MSFFVVASQTTDDGAVATNETENQYVQDVLNFVGIPTFGSAEEAAKAVREGASANVLEIVTTIVASAVGTAKE